jgi:hypothetical protein
MKLCVSINNLPEYLSLSTLSAGDLTGCARVGRPGRTATDVLEIARDVVRKLIKARLQRKGSMNLAALSDFFDYPLIVNA